MIYSEVRKNYDHLPISAIRTDENKIMVRIKKTKSTQKKYNRFRDDIQKYYRKVEIRGYRGLTEIKKPAAGLDVNVCYGDEYIHIIIYGKKSVREKVMENSRKALNLCHMKVIPNEEAHYHN